MATVYKVEIVSDWVNYPPEELKRIIEAGVKTIEKEEGTSNEVQVTEVERKA